MGREDGLFREGSWMVKLQSHVHQHRRKTRQVPSNWNAARISFAMVKNAQKMSALSEFDEPRPASNNVELVFLGSDGACVQEGSDPFMSGNELLCCMGLKKCLQKGLHWQYKCQACHSECPDDNEFPIRRCQR